MLAAVFGLPLVLLALTLSGFETWAPSLSCAPSEEESQPAAYDAAEDYSRGRVEGRLSELEHQVDVLQRENERLEDEVRSLEGEVQELQYAVER
jgi:predicted RNase H-like nuclease (RuvC/YqgF family)